MASTPARHPPRSLPLLLLLLTLATLSSPCVRASSERRRVEAPASPPTAACAGSTRQESHVAPTESGAARRPVRGWSRARRGRGGGGTGAWTFSAMLPRGFVPPSGSSSCHNDMPATAADAQFFDCSGAGTP
ncbi:hypothetical protein BS78_10G157400 [Paspalum vaginatum]|nr:hypothetical protein BS78_10G157400 [Paspalum vaginatum]